MQFPCFLNILNCTVFKSVLFACFILYHFHSYIIFLKALEKNRSGFLVESTLTLADIGLMEALLSMKDFCGMDKLEPYPHLKVIQPI